MRFEYQSSFKEQYMASLTVLSRLTELHVVYTEENYRKLAALIDERYARWQANQQ